MESPTLAWYKYPLPKGTNYTKKDLLDRKNVVIVFDYCQIRLGVIFKEGWQFLFEHYKLEGILDIDKESGWLDDDDLGEWIVYIYYHSFIGGYDPIHKIFGKFDEKNGAFINEKGISKKIDWNAIYHLKNKIKISL